MVGILLSYWEGNFFRGYVSFREGNYSIMVLHLGTCTAKVFYLTAWFQGFSGLDMSIGCSLKLDSKAGKGVSVTLLNHGYPQRIYLKRGTSSKPFRKLGIRANLSPFWTWFFTSEASHQWGWAVPMWPGFVLVQVIFVWLWFTMSA